MILQPFEVHDSWCGTFNCVTIESFSFEGVRDLGARHHRIVIWGLQVDDVDQFEYFDSCEFHLHDDDFDPTALRGQEPLFLARLTELDIEIASDFDLDLRCCPALRSVSVRCEHVDAWSLQSHPLEYLKLRSDREHVIQLKRPISAKHVTLESWQYPETLVIAQAFPDTVHLSLLRAGTQHFVLDLDSMPQLRRLEMIGMTGNLVSRHPIHLHTLIIPISEVVSANITTFGLECNRLAVALQMLPHLRHVILHRNLEMNENESMLMLPRTVTVLMQCSLELLDRAASIHMLLSRFADRTSALQTLHNRIFNGLSHRYDEGLLLRILREAKDVSRFAWMYETYEAAMSQKEQCQAFRHMLQSRRPINWSWIVNKQTHVDALEYLLSEQPELATRAFGEGKRTLLHAVCSDPSSSGSDDVAIRKLCRCLLRHGADPSAMNAQNRTASDAFRGLKDLTELHSSS